MSQFHGLKIIVTGAASGIGLSVCELMSNYGAHVFGIDISDIDDGYKKFFLNGLFIRLDVSIEKNWNIILDQVGSRIDVLINCAGINRNNFDLQESKEPNQITTNIWNKINKLSMDSIIFACRSSIPFMKEYGGSIVNISSTSALKGWPQKAAYATSNASILQYTKSVALDCANNNWSIRCNAVLPGPVDTPMLINNKNKNNFTYRDRNISFADVPMKRPGNPEEIAKPILFLASSKSSYINGIGLCVDGGLSAKTVYSI